MGYYSHIEEFDLGVGGVILFKEAISKEEFSKIFPNPYRGDYSVDTSIPYLFNFSEYTDDVGNIIGVNINQEGESKAYYFDQNLKDWVVKVNQIAEHPLDGYVILAGEENNDIVKYVVQGDTVKIHNARIVFNDTPDKVL